MITVVESQESLLSISVENFANLDQTNREKFMSQLKQGAYGWKQDGSGRKLSNKELADILSRR